MSFDAWGQRRNALDWDALIEAALRDFDSSITDITKRGFTGHEMLDEVGVIHMNGRIYDPRLGRFMQARVVKDRKSTRLNSSHVAISYAVFCLKKKKPRGG